METIFVAFIILMILGVFCTLICANVSDERLEVILKHMREKRVEEENRKNLSKKS